MLGGRLRMTAVCQPCGGMHQSAYLVRKRVNIRRVVQTSYVTEAGIDAACRARRVLTAFIGEKQAMCHLSLNDENYLDFDPSRAIASKSIPTASASRMPSTAADRMPPA